MRERWKAAYLRRMERVLNERVKKEKVNEQAKRSLTRKAETQQELEARKR